jgi:alanine racemase
MTSMKSWTEISEARLRSNLHAIQTAARPAQLLAVVKANAYGHDAALVAPVLTAAGVTWLGVTDTDEALRVRSAVGDEPRILVMSGLEPADAADVLASNLTPVIWSFEHIAALENAAHAARAAAAVPRRVPSRRLPVHLEIDTGMARQGVSLADLPALAARLAASPFVVCDGVFSHLSASEAVASDLTTLQRDRFARSLDIIAAHGLKPAFIHLANTSAIDEGSTLDWLRHTATRLGATPLVRSGLALYGYCLPPVPAPAHTPLTSHPASGNLRSRLQPVLTWKSRLIGIRDIAAGDTVGYGATFRAPAPMRLGLLPVGYADGLRRSASSGLGDGWVILHGRRAPILGRVSMNLTTIDLTHLPSATLASEVTLLGSGVSAEDHAAWDHTIPYDILCAIRSHPTLV